MRSGARSDAERGQRHRAARLATVWSIRESGDRTADLAATWTQDAELADTMHAAWKTWKNQTTLVLAEVSFLQADGV